MGGMALSKSPKSKISVYDDDPMHSPMHSPMQE